MKKNTIKTHLRPYSIFQKRKTTVNHAFASALAPSDPYDEKAVEDAIRALGQEPDADLLCIYCNTPATTWDHLVGLVEKSELRGYGHQIGNLVPSCNSCNSKKGSKDWQVYISESVNDPEKRRNLFHKLSKYQEQFAKPIDLERVKQDHPDEWLEYCSLREQVMELLKKADAIAEKLRPFVKHRQEV